MSPVHIFTFVGFWPALLFATNFFHLSQAISNVPFLFSDTTAVHIIFHFSVFWSSYLLVNPFWLMTLRLLGKLVRNFEKDLLFSELAIFSCLNSDLSLRWGEISCHSALHSKARSRQHGFPSPLSWGCLPGFLTVDSLACTLFMHTLWWSSLWGPHDHIHYLEFFCMGYGTFSKLLFTIFFVFVFRDRVPFWSFNVFY